MTTNIDKVLEKGPVYVRNCTNPKGPINLTLMHQSGRLDSITVPKTYIPICLTDQVPNTLLKESIDFRACINSGILEIVSKEDAEKVLKTRGAKTELARIYSSKYSEKSAKIAGLKSDQKTENPASEDKVADRIVDILLRKMPQIDTLNELKTIEGEIRKADFRHLIENTSGRVKKWALKKIASCSDEEEDND